MSQTAVATESLVIKRTYAAPVEKVYSAWSDPAQMVKWFASNLRWKAPALDIDPVVGGRHNIVMRHSDGDEVKVAGHYVEIVPNQRLVFTWTFLDMPSWEDAETRVTVEFKTVTGGTELTLIHERIPSAAERDATIEGWTGFVEMLESYLEGGPSLTP